MSTITLRAGILSTNRLFFHRVRFSVGDPAALIEVREGSGATRSTLILRAIEMDRARKAARADAVHCPEDFPPAGGLSGDREVGTAQATAEFIRRAGAKSVIADRTLPLLYIHELAKVGVGVQCDPDLGISARRAKDAQEVAWLREAQSATERVMRRACETVGRAIAGKGGVLQYEGSELTSERLKVMIDIWFLEMGYTSPGAIVAGGKQGSDCHDYGTGPLRTSETVIIDIWPQNKKTYYNGDCTRTVVHGAIPPEVAQMHATVVEAKHAATRAIRAGVTGEDVHRAALAVITKHGYETKLPPAGAPDSWCAMTHGTGHGIGLDVHEPPLLDFKGPPLVIGDALTVEPGLYCRAIGGVRVEDLVIVTRDGCDNLNTLPEGLEWGETR